MVIFCFTKLIQKKKEKAILYLKKIIKTIKKFFSNYLI